MLSHALSCVLSEFVCLPTLAHSHGQFCFVPACSCLVGWVLPHHKLTLHWPQARQAKLSKGPRSSGTFLRSVHLLKIDSRGPLLVAVRGPPSFCSNEHVAHYSQRLWQHHSSRVTKNYVNFSGNSRRITIATSWAVNSLPKPHEHEAGRNDDCYSMGTVLENIGWVHNEILIKNIRMPAEWILKHTIDSTQPFIRLSQWKYDPLKQNHNFTNGFPRK